MEIVEKWKLKAKSSRQKGLSLYLQTLSEHLPGSTQEGSPGWVSLRGQHSCLHREREL